MRGLAKLVYSYKKQRRRDMTCNFFLAVPKLCETFVDFRVGFNWFIPS